MGKKNVELKPGHWVHGIFQNVELKFKVSKAQPTGPDVFLEHDRGEVHVRKQDIRDGKFELVVKKCA
jgi:hypothetical protein